MGTRTPMVAVGDQPPPKSVYLVLDAIQLSQDSKSVTALGTRIPSPPPLSEASPLPILGVQPVLLQYSARWSA